jgi:hypothetical protein
MSDRKIKLEKEFLIDYTLQTIERDAATVAYGRRYSARTPQSRNISIEVVHHTPRRPEEISLGAIDAIIYIFAALCFILPFMMPEYQVAWLMGVALLISTLTRSALAKIAAASFTVTYFLLFLLTGWYFEMDEVFRLLFGVNTVSLIPAIVGTIIAIVAMGSGAVHGLSRSTKYAGIWLIGLAFIISLADALIAIFFLAVEEWYLIFALHLAIYITALLIAWGIFYVPLWVIRRGIDAAAGGEE